MTHLYTKLAACGRLLTLLLLVALFLPGRAQTIASFTPASGPAGTPVTITGRDLDKVTGVRFGTGSLTLNFVAQSAGSLTVLVPVVAASGPLLLTNASGATVSTASAFTYTPRPAGLVATLAPAGPLDGCQPRTLTASASSPAFATGAGFDGPLLTLAVQPDGKVLAGGGFSTYNGRLAHKLIRLNPDGSPDTTFLTGAGFDNVVQCVAVQADGKLLVGGGFTTYQGQLTTGLLRLNADGSPDAGFPTSTGFNGRVWSVAVQADGRILVGGSFTAYRGQPANRLIRLQADGSPDATFVTGTGFDNEVYAVVMQADGKVVVGGFFLNYQNKAAGSLLRLQPDGSRDASFVVGTGFRGYVSSVAVQPDGNVLPGGNFTAYQGQPANRLLRLQADGSRDASFAANTDLTYSVTSVLVQPDSRVLIGGGFTAYQGQPANGLVRLRADGSRDPGFSTGTGFNAFVHSAALQADGNVLVGGNFTSYNGTKASHLVRLHPDGSPQDAATPVTGASFTFAPGGAATNPLVTSTPGSYTATASLNGETSAPSNAVVLTACLLPTRPAAAGAALSLAPNPAPGGAATLSGSQPGAAVRVLDALGRVVATATADAGGVARLLLPAGLAPGVYVVRSGGQAARLAVE